MIEFDDLKIINNPWPHVFLPHNFDQSFCANIVKKIRNFDLSQIPDEDKQDGIITGTLNQGDIPAVDFLFNKNFHKKILDFWQVPYDLGFKSNVVWDWCNNQGSNGWHCDLGNSTDTKDVITLQWYLHQPNPKRNLVLRNQEQSKLVNTSDGSFVMFRSHPYTNHMFASGEGERISLRLRIKTNLVSETYIHHQNKDDKFGCIIDCKDMDVSADSLEHNLGNFTRLNLLHNDWHNLIVIDHHSQFDTAFQRLVNFGCDTVLMLFAGAVVSKSTKSELGKWPHTLIGHKGKNRIYRKYLVIPSKCREKIQQQEYFAQNIMDQTVDKHNHELGIYYVHPEKNTYQFLKNIQKFMMPDVEGIDPADANNISQYVKKAQNNLYF